MEVEEKEERRESKKMKAGRNGQAMDNRHKEDTDPARQGGCFLEEGTGSERDFDRYKNRKK